MIESILSCLVMVSIACAFGVVAYTTWDQHKYSVRMREETEQMKRDANDALAELTKMARSKPSGVSVQSVSLDELHELPCEVLGAIERDIESGRAGDNLESEQVETVKEKIREERNRRSGDVH